MQVEALRSQNSALSQKYNLLNAASHDTVANVISEQQQVCICEQCVLYIGKVSCKRRQAGLRKNLKSDVL